MLERWENVQLRIKAACSRVGRDPEMVRVVAVSKTHPPDSVRALYDCGLTVFGENRVQEAQTKISMCPSRITWHMVGHLQSNKVRPAVRLFDMIHSVDSLKLLRALDAAADQAGRHLPVLLEINVAGEGTKFGLTPAAAADVLRDAGDLCRLEIVGLMAVPPVVPEPENARPYFRKLRELRDKLRDDTAYALPELSMGMSQDFEVAVEEGATWLRLGTVLFGRRN